MVTTASPAPAPPASAVPAPRAGALRAGVFLPFAYALGACTSIVVPFVSARAGGQAHAIFGLYFACLVAGQLAVYKFRAFTESRGLTLFVQTLLWASFVTMALVPTPLGLLLGRAAQGAAGGVVVVQLLHVALRASAPAARDRNVALINSCYALGYATGPVLGRALEPLVGAAWALIGFGALIFLMSTALLLRPPPAAPALAPALPGGSRLWSGWFERFYLLFIAKLFYGYVLTFLTAQRGLPGRATPLWLVLLAMSLVFVLGQLIGARAASSRPALLIGAPVALGLGAALLAFRVWPSPASLGVAALLHSVLYFVGVRASGIKLADARTYALYNALSDPGMVVGAVISGHGLAGAAGVLALCTAPLGALLTGRRAAAQS